MNQYSGGGMRCVEGRKFLRSEVDRVRHEVFLQQRRMFLQRSAEGFKDYPFFGQLLAPFDMQKTIVGEYRLGRMGKGSLTLSQEFAFGSIALPSGLEVAQLNRVDGRKAPILILTTRHGRGLKFLPSLRSTRRPPSRFGRSVSAGGDLAVFTHRDGSSYEPFEPMASTGQPSIASLASFCSSGLSGCL